MIVTWSEIHDRLRPHDQPGVLVYGVPENGMILTSLLRRALAVSDPEQASIILDDYIHEGGVREHYSLKYRKIFVALFDRPVLMPWMVTSQGFRK